MIAGINDLNVTLKESNANFTFNFAEVYWNSRLQMEHHRIISLISDDLTASISAFSSTKGGSGNSGASSNMNNKGIYREQHKPIIIADMMAGVGPFAIPLGLTAKREEKKMKKESKMVLKLDGKDLLQVYANGKSSLSSPFSSYITPSLFLNCECFSLNISRLMYRVVLWYIRSESSLIQVPGKEQSIEQY